MRYSAKLLSLATLAALLANLLNIPRVGAALTEPTTHSEPAALAQIPTSDRQAEANQLFQQGLQQNQISQFREALQSWEAALSIYRQINNRYMEGASLTNLGNAYHSLGQNEQAIDFLQRALVIQREINDRQGEAISLGSLGLTYYALGQYEQAIDFHQKSLAIEREIGNRQGETISLSDLGLAYNALGQYEQAIDFFQQALVIAHEIGDPQEEGANLNNLGMVYETLGQYEQAIEFLQQALAIAHEAGNRQGEANAFNNLGIAHSSLSQYQQAIDFHQQSSDIRREIGDLYGEADSLNNLGGIYTRLGQYEQAIDFHQQSLVIAREIGDRQEAASALNNLGVVYTALGQYEQAVDFHQQSLVIAREIGSQKSKAYSLMNLGNAYISLSQYEQASNFLQQAISVARAIGDRRAEANSLNMLGVLHDLMGQHGQAINFLQQSLDVSREIGHRTGEGHALNNRGAALIKAGQFSQAESSLSRGIEVFESLRADLSDEQLISIADTQFRAYANLERALTAQSKTAEALSTTERRRGRAFVLQLASRLVSEEERAEFEASAVVQVPTVAEIRQTARDTNTTLVTYSLIYDQALYIWVVQPSGDIEFRSVEFERAGDVAPTLNPIASIDGPVYRSASPDSELTALVNDARSRSLSGVEVNSNPNTPQLQELHEVLIDPIADLLPSDPNAQVAFIPQGELFLVPFAALQDEDGTYLVEKHTILTAPSIQVFGLASEAGSLRLRSENENNRFLSGVVGAAAPAGLGNALVVGNPTMPTVWLPNADGFAATQLSNLPGAKAEAEAIGGFFDIPVLTGAQATEAAVKQQLPNASLIHLATHGLLDYGIPESSGVLDVPGAVALAPGNGEDGLLTSAEILEMDLQAELAVLSACDTGRGRITGDGVVGLSRALITAGVPSVMVSLWAVNDDSTSILMQRFYEILATGEFTKAEALRQAQLSLLYAEDVETRLAAARSAGATPLAREGFEPVGDRHPYHWAPFVLIGNGQ